MCIFNLAYIFLFFLMVILGARHLPAFPHNQPLRNTHYMKNAYKNFVTKPARTSISNDIDSKEVAC